MTERQPHPSCSSVFFYFSLPGLIPLSCASKNPIQLCRLLHVPDLLLSYILRLACVVSQPAPHIQHLDVSPQEWLLLLQLRLAFGEPAADHAVSDENGRKRTEKPFSRFRSRNSSSEMGAGAEQPRAETGPGYTGLRKRTKTAEN
jgi:hypothetical protein